MGAGGRPKITLQDLPENWKEIILELAAQGASECEIRCALTVKDGKFYEGLWYSLQEREQEFSQVMKMARVLSQGWWEWVGRTSIKSEHFNHVLWFMNIKNRFKKDWMDVNRNITMQGNSDDKKFRDEFFGIKSGTGAANE